MQQQADTVITLTMCSDTVGPAADAGPPPNLEDPSKAEAWQKLTHLQQHMQGLITAVEHQLTLTHRTDKTHPATQGLVTGAKPLDAHTDTAADQVSLPQLGLLSFSHGQAEGSAAQLGQDSGSAELPCHSEADLAIGTHADSQTAGKTPEERAEADQAAAGEVAQAAGHECAADAESTGEEPPCNHDASSVEVKRHEQVRIYGIA